MENEEKVYKVELSGNVENVFAVLEFLAKNPGWLIEGEGQTVCDLEKCLQEHGSSNE